MNPPRVPLSAFTASPFPRVRVHPQRREFGYSDGEAVEQRILRILQSTSDLSVASAELQASIDDWPTEYHFTETRANLLRHLPLRPGARVLELGAGCGAITRFLGEAQCEVVAVEGSLLRARCAAERTRDLDRVAVHCANFQDIAFDAAFDVVTLIGVLEYAPKFFAAADPMLACLEVARSALAEGGVLIVAIENQLGLKYFAGATEDHLGTHYSGLEDLYPHDGVRTLGRRQLEDKLKAAGFAHVEFAYPFPDYKLPLAVVSQRGADRPGFLASELVRHLQARDYAGHDARTIETSQVWPVLEGNGLLGELANSFLVVASQARPIGPPDELAWSYSAGRAPAFQTCTRFVAGEDGTLRTSKSKVHPNAAPPSAPAGVEVVHRLVSEPYIAGRTLHSSITAALRRRAPDRVLQDLRRWLDDLRDAANASGSIPGTLAASMWDRTPHNLIDDGGTLRAFDAEWEVEPAPRISDLLLRYLTGLAFSEATGAQFAACFGKRPGAALRHVLDQLGMPLTQDMLDGFTAAINGTNAVIFPGKPPIAPRLQDYDDAPDRPAARARAANLLRRLADALAGKDR